MILKQLRKIFNEINSSASKLHLYAYSSDASRIEGHPKAVVFPTDLEKLRKLVKLAKRLDVPLTPRGAGTNTVGSAVPIDSIVVDMSKLKRILRMDDDSVIVEAGCLLGELNLRLKQAFLFGPHKTIGGLIATNSQGKFGRFGSYVKELEIMDGSGRIETLVDDRCNHFIGKEGATGIIITAKLKLPDNPKTKSVSLFSFNTISSLFIKLQELKNDPNILTIRYLDEAISDIMFLGCKNHIIAEHFNDEGSIKDKKDMQGLIELMEKADSTLKTLGFIENEEPLMPSKDLDKYLYWLKKKGIPVIADLKHNFIKSYFKKKELSHKETKSVIKKLNGQMNALGTGLKYKKEFVNQKSLTALKSHYDPRNIMNRGQLT